MWSSRPLLITYYVPDLRAPADPSSGEHVYGCRWATRLKPQPGNSEKRCCLLVAHSWTHDSDTPRTCNESYESCHYFLAYRLPLTLCSEGAQTQPQRLLPSPSRGRHLCVVWADRTLVVGKNVDLDHLRSKQHRNASWRTSVSVG